MHSMTGYGCGSLSRDGRQLLVELRAVNHRHLDLQLRMPRLFNFLEDTVRKRIAQSVSRGHIDLFVTYRNLREDSKTVQIDRALLAAYENVLAEIAETTGVRDDRSLMGLAQMNDVLVVSEADDDEAALSALFIDALNEALLSLCAMRAREGESLREDITARLNALDAINRQIESRYPETVAEYSARLRARVAELLENAAIDEGRLLQEVAIMADRSTIAEETVRFKSHLKQFRAEILSEEPVGRKLDFLVQELNREVNTMSSKSQDVPITRLTISAKAEIEKIREQIQNIE